MFCPTIEKRDMGLPTKGHDMGLLPCHKIRHSSALNKISGRLSEGREFIASYDIESSVVENARQSYKNRWYGNVSERNCRELTRHFTQRYVITPEHFQKLRQYIHHTLARDFPWLNHFYMLLDDPYYRWATAGFMADRYQAGLLEIPRSRFDQELKQQLPPTVGPGSLTRYGQNLLTAIRDNGLLEGRVKKVIVSPPLSVNTMAFMLYTLSDLGVGANAFDRSPLFFSLLKPREILVPLFHEGGRRGYWDFNGDHEKLSLTLNYPGLQNWLEKEIYHEP